MKNRRYETHLLIRRDKLCPFYFRLIENAVDSICNWHKNIEVILITQGMGTIRYGNRDLDFRAGDIIVVNSETLHWLYSKQGMSFYYLIIDESFCIENGITTDNRVFVPLFQKEETKSLFEAAAGELTVYYNEKKTVDSCQIQASKVRLSVLRLLIDLCENHSTIRETQIRDKKHSEDYVKKVIAYMEMQYKERVTLDSLATMCGITKCYLAREFKAYTGQTVLTYLNMLRCKNAEASLAAGMSVTETAYECGFESVSYFSRTYKKLMGTLPSKSMKK